MSRCDAQEFTKKIPDYSSIAGLDIGAKTIGVAIGTFPMNIATPLETIKRTKFKYDAKHIKEIITKYEISGLVIGYPIDMSGEEGRRCQSVRDFMAELENHIDCPDYMYQDERLSTAAVDNFLDNFVDKRKAKEKGLIDKLAAQVILQSFFDSLV